MADSYSILWQQRSIQVLGPALVRDVETVGFITKPTGIILQFPVPWDIWLAEGASIVLGEVALGVEGLISSGFAVDGSFAQDEDANGLLVDYVDMRVRYVPPDPERFPMTATARIPLNLFLTSTDIYTGGGRKTPVEIIQPVYDALVATAGL